ncbi:MAG: hypothetical protein RLZ96_5 [Actinomycetota bacterium]
MELCSVCLQFFFDCECEFCECVIKKSTFGTTEED